MINGRYVSLGSVMWKIMRNPLMVDLSYEQLAEYALEFLRIVGAPLFFKDENLRLDMDNYKVRLPDNIITIRGVKFLGADGTTEGTAMRYATNIYHNTVNLDPSTRSESLAGEYTYTINNCVLQASVKKGVIEVAYKAIVTDDNGYPMIPDNESLKTAIEYYVNHRHLELLWAMGKVADKVFQYYEQKRHFYTGQACNEFKLAGPDHLESAMNGINRLIVQDKAFDNFYKNFGETEYIKQLH